MRINNNIMAMNAHRQLAVNQSNASKSMERLSSGMRINRAGDDAAGLAISEKMRGQIRGLKQAQRNAQDGISLIQTAEGALNETHAILQRMRELANQASTDTNTLTDRKEIQKEINQLLDEIDRIAKQTEFNTQKLLDGTYSSKVFHIGANADQKMDVSISNMGTTAIGTAGRTGAAGGGTTPAQAATATVDGVTFTATETGEDFNDYTISFQDGTTEGVAVDRNSKTIVVTLDFSNTPTTDASSWTVNATGAGTGSFTVSGTFTGDVNSTGTTAGGAEEVAGGGTATNIDALAVDDADIDSLAATLTDAEVEAALQAAGSGVGVLTQAGANAAITNINDAIEQVSAERSKLGAMQNRLEHTIANLGTSAENLQAAESRIRDLDMAEEIMAFTKNNILQQAATAMLAQANMAPQSVLQLLG